jgi:uncharacterized phiE125 gp8 family phage protein
MPFIPTQAPGTAITLAEAKAHLRIPSADTSEDDYVSTLISAANTYVETVCDVVLVSGTYQEHRGHLSNRMQLPVAPVISVDSVVLTNTAGTETTVSTSVYGLDSTTRPPTVRLRTDEEWPDVELGTVDPVVITFTAGYGSTDNVPSDLKHALKLLIGHWYLNRESVALGTIASKVPQTVDALLAPYKTYSRGNL